tara:strand:- start:8886 stop:9500 length:615 start_codon:yes stop_codon:yes gene_type:complete
MIVIIDYGMGNLGSVLKSIKRIESNVIISKNKDDILRADKLILPGVGNFSKGILNLKKYNYIEPLNKKVLKDKIPILGICLGMQLFSKFSDEGGSEGLGWIDAKVTKFKIKNKLKWKIPHIGWNSICINKENNKLLNNITNECMFYFVHSYHMVCNDDLDVLSFSNYENSFVSSINKKNIYGTQFHPEKSHNDGFNLIKNFISI